MKTIYDAHIFSFFVVQRSRLEQIGNVTQCGMLIGNKASQSGVSVEHRIFS